MRKNYVLPKDNRLKYQFVTNETEEIRQRHEKQKEYNNQMSYFYQITTFPDPQSNKFHMRKFTINGNNEFLDIRDFNLTKKQCKSFYVTKKPQEYKRYDLYNLNSIKYPTLAEIYTSKSNILQTNSDYTGYAPFN